MMAARHDKMFCPAVPSGPTLKGSIVSGQLISGMQPMSPSLRPHCPINKVTYDFNRARMMMEPLLLAGFFLACFLAAMAAGRVDMRIRRGGADAAPTKG